MCNETNEKNDVEEGGAISSDMALIYPVSILSGAVNQGMVYVLEFCIKHWCLIVGVFAMIAAGGLYQGVCMGVLSLYVFLAVTAFFTVPLGLVLVLAYMTCCFFMVSFFGPYCLQHHPL